MSQRSVKRVIGEAKAQGLDYKFCIFGQLNQVECHLFEISNTKLNYENKIYKKFYRNGLKIGLK